MEKKPQVRFVFDRRKTATKSSSKDAKTGSVEIEIYHNRKRKVISTGVRVFLDQWTDRSMVRNRIDASEVNAILQEQYRSVLSSVADVISKYGMFTFDLFESRQEENKASNMTFIEFMEKRIEERTDIRESTRKHHRVIVGELKSFGKIIGFSDLTPGNIMLYDDWMRRNGLEQTTIYAHHKNVITYIHQADKFGLTTLPYPYTGLHIERGKTSKHNFLSIQELRKIESCELPTDALAKSRDLFLFMCYTGLSYVDMMAFNFSRDVIERDGVYIFIGDRVKTGEDFQIVFIPKVMEILKRYEYTLPSISNQKLNLNLKMLAVYSGIKKQLSCHDARRTFCSIAINQGVNIEVVAKMLGHSNSKTTAAFYSRITDESVKRGFDDISKAFDDEK